MMQSVLWVWNTHLPCVSMIVFRMRIRVYVRGRAFRLTKFIASRVRGMARVRLNLGSWRSREFIAATPPNTAPTSMKVG